MRLALAARIDRTSDGETALRPSVINGVRLNRRIDPRTQAVESGTPE